jgi:hypothetical protein
MINLELPSGKAIELKWGTWAMKRCCKLLNISLSELFEQFGDGKLHIDFVVACLQAASEYPQYKATGKHFTISELEVCDWIDECGGIGSEKIVDVFGKMVEAMVLSTSAFSNNGEEKKS